MNEQSERPESASSKADQPPSSQTESIPPDKLPVGLGIAALLLIAGAWLLRQGVWPLYLALLSGVLSILTAHSDYRRRRKAKNSTGSSIAGLATGYLSTFAVALILFVFLPNAAAKAQRIKCLANLKAIGQSARWWANDNGEKFPPDWVSMTNELTSARYLICPSDTRRSVPTINMAEAGAYARFLSTPANITYEWVAPPPNTDEPTKTLARCPIHNNVLSADGSVRQLK